MRKNVIKDAKQRAAAAKAAADRIITELRWDAEKSPLHLVFRGEMMPEEMKTLNDPRFPEELQLGLQLPWMRAAAIIRHSTNYFFEDGNWCVDGWDLMTRGLVGVAPGDGEGKSVVRFPEMTIPDSELPANPTTADFAAEVMWSYSDNVEDLEKKDPRLARSLRFALDEFEAPPMRAAARAEKEKADKEKEPSPTDYWRSEVWGIEARTLMKCAYEFAFLGKSDVEGLLNPVAEPAPELRAAILVGKQIRLGDEKVN
jgi:hypothetical protein